MVISRLFAVATTVSCAAKAEIHRIAYRIVAVGVIFTSEAGDPIQHASVVLAMHETLSETIICLHEGSLLHSAVCNVVRIRG